MTTATPVTNTITEPEIVDGRLLSARQQPSPNFNQRPDPNDISLLVVHNISLPPEEFGEPYIEQFFCNQLDCSQHPYFKSIRDLQVSAHLLITRKAEIIQFVSFDQRAWHAGESNFEGRTNCNDFSIGIELEGSDHLPFTEGQYKQLATVSQQIIKQYPLIKSEQIVGHSDIAPGRKTDPGPAFSWDKYRALLGE